MSETYVPQPPIVDGDGNINVHGREGISIPIKRRTGDPATSGTTQIDISGDTFTFEMEGLTPVPLIPDPNDAKGLLLLIPSLSAAGVIVPPTGQGVPFVLRDTTGTPAVVRWEGRVIARGWE